MEPYCNKNSLMSSNGLQKKDKCINGRTQEDHCKHVAREGGGGWQEQGGD